MKRLFTIAIVAFSVYSCGDAGIGFNIGKEFPLTMPVSFDNFDLPVSPPINYDPNGFSVEDSYELDKVDAFSDELNNLDEVVINAISYEITGVEPSDQIEVQTLELELFQNGVSLGVIDITDQLSGSDLTNISKTEISSLDLNSLSTILKNGGEVGTEATFDFGELPPNDFEFDFTFHFDVTIKVRDL